MRLSIDVTPEQHQKLKAIAALQGQSLKSYVLNRVLPAVEPTGDSESLRQLEAFLEPRIKAAQSETVTLSVAEIFEETLRESV